MLGLFGGKRPRPNLGTMTIDPDDPALRRSVRVFISHRWDDDPAFRGIILGSLAGLNGLPIDDLSLTTQQRIEGNRGGRVDPLQIRLELAERIRRCDVFFVPADTGAADAEWLQFETEKAAEYRRPVVFVSHNWRRARWNRYVKRLKSLNLPSAMSTTDPQAILAAAKSMLPKTLH
jgi:hypothetical protein